MATTLRIARKLDRNDPITKALLAQVGRTALEPQVPQQPERPIEAPADWDADKRALFDRTIRLGDAMAKRSLGYRGPEQDGDWETFMTKHLTIREAQEALIRLYGETAGGQTMDEAFAELSEVEFKQLVRQLYGEG